MITKVSLGDFAAMKQRHEKIAVVTAYDAPSARLADAAGVDVVLVGDSAAMTVLGYDSTVPVTVDEMLMLTRAVTRGARRPFIVAKSLRDTLVFISRLQPNYGPSRGTLSMSRVPPTRAAITSVRPPPKSATVT